MPNLSIVDDSATAHTRAAIAAQRAENLACLGVKSVLELCVGPSYNVLATAYAKYGIDCFGNDIDFRWKLQPGVVPDMWLNGDCLAVPWLTEAVVFAPPLTKGCTGTHRDSLMIEEVTPSYESFIAKYALRHHHGLVPKVAVLVLPGRSLSTRDDRAQYFSLLRRVTNWYKPRPKSIEPIEMIDGCRKYVDVYIQY